MSLPLKADITGSEVPQKPSEYRAFFPDIKKSPFWVCSWS